MPLYEIVFARSVRKELQALSYTVAKRILEKVELLALTPGLLAVRSYADIQVFGEYELVSTELFTVLTMTTELSMYQLSGIEVKHIDRCIFLLTLRLGHKQPLYRRNQPLLLKQEFGDCPSLTSGLRSTVFIPSES